MDPVTGDVYAGGSAASPNFPGVSGGARPTLGGGTQDAFLSRLSPSLTILRQSTFFGGSGGVENAVAIGVHPSGQVYATGATDSPDLPGTAGGAQPGFGGLLDAYLARFDPMLQVLHQATYLGGSRPDFAEDLALPPNGEVYVAGTTESSDFPRTAGGAQPAFAGVPGFGVPDAFVSRVSLGAGGRADFTDSNPLTRRHGLPGDPVGRGSFRGSAPARVIASSRNTHRVSQKEDP